MAVNKMIFKKQFRFRNILTLIKQNGFILFYILLGISTIRILDIAVTKSILEFKQSPLEIVDLPLDFISGYTFFILLNIFLVYNLILKKRLVYFFTFFLILSNILLHLAHHVNFFRLSIEFCQLILLILYRKKFTVLKSQNYARQKTINLGLLIFIFVGYYIFGFYFLSNSFAGTINFQNIFGNYLANFIDPTSISYYANDIIGKTYFAKAYIHSLDYVGWIILALILINSLPDNKLEPIKSDSLDKNLISEVLKYDTDSLSVFKHSSKLDYYEYKGNYIFYLVSNSFRIVLGNPIVANPDYKDCLKEFIKLSHKNGFVVAFFQVDEKFRFDLQKVGFKDILLGQEALLSLEKFDILSIENKKLKKAGDKIERGGVELEFIAYRDLKPKVIKVIESLRKDWIKSKGNRLSLTVDYWPLNNEIEGWIVLAKDSEQDYIGVGSFVPYFDQCLSFDFMIKNSQAKSQFIDGVIAKSILRFKDMGFKEMSLGIAPSEFLSQNKSANLILKLALSFQKIKYNYSGLRTFKAKFNPTWKEKYILIEGYETLPAFLAALLKGFKSN